MTKKHLFQNGLALLMCLFLFAGMSFAQTKTATITISNPGERTWMVPNEIEGEAVTGVTSLTFEAWGGGGAGGYAYSSGILKSAGGGGGAAYAKSATLTDVNVGDRFLLTIGAPGIARGDDASHYTVQNGGTTYVYAAGENLLAKAVGGKSVTGTQNLNGAAGGNKNDCYGSTTASGGKGGNAYGGLGSQSLGIRSGAWCITGSGGGAGGPGGNGGDAENSWFNGNLLEYLWDLINGEDAHALQITGQPGQGNGSGAGSGGMGIESQIFGSGGWGNAQGNAGGNYGGGGSGAIGNGLSWGDANGGQGGSGAVRIVITYTTGPTESVEVANASANVCSGADFDVTLNITATGFNLNQATVIPNSTSNPSLSVSAGTSFNTTDGKWHLTGSATNTTSNTIEFPITVTVTSPDGTASDNATITLNVYGKLNGGVIAKDQLICADQTIDYLKGDGSVVTGGLYYSSVTTAEASGGSGSGSYQWYAKDMNSSGDFEPITGANANNYRPSNGYYYFKREYLDAECGSTWATDGHGGTFLIAVTVNPLTITETDFSEDTICSNEDYYHSFSLTYTSPAENWFDEILWQKSTDKGNTWVYAGSTVAGSVYVHYYPNELEPGTDVWFRYAFVFGDCDPIPGNSIQKIHVKKAPDYTDQFPDLNITLWYGACDTSIAELVPPVLTPTPASITRTDDHGNRLIPGEYELTWSVIADDCNIPVTYTQNVIVEFPKCGTLEEPYVITDRYGYEYNTIRIGCDCWLAENLRTNADNATYYDNDDANEAFGRLYDWNDAVGSFNYEMETKLGTTYIQGVCPMGWAMPTVAQYNKVKEAAGSAEGVKSDDANAWLPDLVGTNTVGFAAMGAGFYSGMEYQRLLGYTDFWTADDNESNSSVAKAMELRPGCDELLPVDKNKADKLSVRCVRVEPLDYVNINIEFDMQDSYGDGWSEGYIRATYGSSTVMLTVTADENICTLPVPRGSDVTLEWLAANMSSEASFTITNEETGEVIAEGSGSSSNVELAQFHVDGVSNPADFQTVDFDLSNVLGSWGYTGLLEVDYGTGKLNLGIASDEDVHSTVAFPAGTHIKLSWIDANDYDYVVALTVKYTGASTYLLEVEEGDLEEGVLLEFDVVKQ